MTGIFPNNLYTPLVPEQEWSCCCLFGTMSTTFMQAVRKVSGVIHTVTSQIPYLQRSPDNPKPLSKQPRVSASKVTISYLDARSKYVVKTERRYISPSVRYHPYRKTQSIEI